MIGSANDWRFEIRSKSVGNHGRRPWLPKRNDVNTCYDRGRERPCGNPILFLIHWMIFDYQALVRVSMRADVIVGRICAQTIIFLQKS